MGNKKDDISPEQYRARLNNKLNCLVAVLEVAIAKIDRTMDGPSANTDRLNKIRENLENTLAICRRASKTLQSDTSAMPEMPAVDLKKAAEQARMANDFQAKAQKPITRKSPRDMTYRDYVELSSVKEYRKFKQLPPIKKKDLEEADLDTLMRKLQAG